MIKRTRYTRKDRRLLFWVIIPFTLVLNAVIFGGFIFLDGLLFLIATPVTLLVMAGSLLLYGYLAALLRHRFPRDEDFFKRAMILIVLFLIVSPLILLGLFGIFYAIGLLTNGDNEHGFTWAFVVTGILNIFLTFLSEGVSRFESWKANLEETEQLKLAYKQSQLMGLKSQVNPHFLFNSLNSLSGLIQEDTGQAEKFLNEMSKVYRYMLRNEEEQLVSLFTEIQFIQSYFSLLKVRYTDAILLDINIADNDIENLLPPLSLQVIVENALILNRTEKNAPLHLRIFSGMDGTVIVTNNVQPRVTVETTDFEAGLDNLVKKYRLLASMPVVIEETSIEKRIILPLIRKKEELV
jgi:hypothetical protein